jgi:hypothetical protein
MAVYRPPERVSDRGIYRTLVKTPSLPGADFATIMPSKQDVINLTGFENSAKILA